MNDILKTVNRIAAQPVKKTKKNGYLIREVIRVIGIMGTVKSEGHPNEPEGRYAIWLTHNQDKGIQKAIDDSKTVNAHIHLVKNRWTVIQFEIIEPEPVTAEQIAEQKLESEKEQKAFADY